MQIYRLETNNYKLIIRLNIRLIKIDVDLWISYFIVGELCLNSFIKSKSVKKSKTIRFLDY